MKTELQKHLATLAPSIAIRTIWEPDQDSGPISCECDGFDSSEDYDWQAWQSEIRATAICQGEEITGSAYLGGTFEKAGDSPEISNPEISGYENQMTQEALCEFARTIPGTSPLHAEIQPAIEYLIAEAQRSYDAQRAEIEAPRPVAYAVKTAKGYLATQGAAMWFESEPVGWALFSTEEGARDALEENHSALGTAPHEGGEIVTVKA